MLLVPIIFILSPQLLPIKSYSAKQNDITSTRLVPCTNITPEFIIIDPLIKKKCLSIVPKR